ncbi:MULTISPECIES: hypothetical protein [unclassified Actinopolyspora]|uniref:hypothetical protein n=1 Tax=unclassified Actinopolyspora TaxID=2639451 RepID=UPI0013F61ADB|nr:MULTISPECIES: hypothetical protein [unclassified Actinopolyspora]NHD17712.1 hypothetical protein [Actinopolyspora sp. BKK2]NHE76555.1 hypothetical protein [Actinopolyspora sp. BKK1]
MRYRRPAREAAPSPVSRVTAGTAIALLVVPGFFFLLGTADALRANGVDGAEVREVLVGVAVMVRGSAPSVLLFGLPVAVLTERVCSRARLPVTLLAFALAGAVAGVLAASVLFHPLFSYYVVPFAVVSAVSARALSGPVARRPVLWWVFVLLAAVVLLGACFAVVR